MIMIILVAGVALGEPVQVGSEFDVDLPGGGIGWSDGNLEPTAVSSDGTIVLSVQKQGYLSDGAEDDGETLAEIKPEVAEDVAGKAGSVVHEKSDGKQWSIIVALEDERTTEKAFLLRARRVIAYPERMFPKQRLRLQCTGTYGSEKAARAGLAACDSLKKPAEKRYGGPSPSLESLTWKAEGWTASFSSYGGSWKAHPADKDPSIGQGAMAKAMPAMSDKALLGFLRQPDLLGTRWVEAKVSTEDGAIVVRGKAMRKNGDPVFPVVAVQRTLGEASVVCRSTFGWREALPPDQVLKACAALKAGE